MVKYEPPVYMPDDDDASSMDSYSQMQFIGRGGSGTMSFNEFNGTAADTSHYSDQVSYFCA